jgi:formylglycine-generating enzyme required for sulfatase activity
MRHLDKKYLQITTIQNLQAKIGIGESAIDNKIFHLRFTKNKKNFVEDSLDYRMVLCEPSPPFWKGADDLDSPFLYDLIQKYPASAPAFRTRISRPFLVLEHEVTQGFWKKIVALSQEDSRLKQEPYKYVSASASGYIGARKPIQNKTWNECILFCNMLSILQGLKPCYKIKGYDIVQNDKKFDIKNMQVEWDRSANGYRLPTDAEMYYLINFSYSEEILDHWVRFKKKIHLEDYMVGKERLEEYAKNTPDFLARQKAIQSDKSLNYTEKSQAEKKLLKELTGPMDVKSKKPSNWGIYDLLGNVNEFCYDDYSRNVGVYFARKQTKENGSIQVDVAFESSLLKTGAERAYYFWGYDEKFYLQSDPKLKEKMNKEPFIHEFKICRGFSYKNANRYEDYTGRFSEAVDLGDASFSYSGNENIGFRLVRNL